MEKNKLSVSFNIVNIQEKQFSTFEIPDVDTGKKKQKIGFGFGADPLKRVIACGCHYTLLVNEQPFLTIHLLCFFEIDERAWIGKLIEGEKVILPKDFATHLASITASTARGVLFSNTKNTIHQRYLMGLIDPTNFIRENILISI